MHSYYSCLEAHQGVLAGGLRLSDSSGPTNQRLVVSQLPLIEKMSHVGVLEQAVIVQGPPSAP